MPDKMRPEDHEPRDLTAQRAEFKSAERSQPNSESAATDSSRSGRASSLSVRSARFQGRPGREILQDRGSESNSASLAPVSIPRLMPSDVVSAPHISARSVDFAGAAMRRRNRQDSLEPSIEARSHSAKILSQAVKGEYQYAKLGLILGVLAILGGIVLGLHGVTGHTSWTAKVLGFESNINDAAPGVVLFVVGIFFVWITKPRVKLGDLRG